MRPGRLCATMVLPTQPPASCAARQVIVGDSSMVPRHAAPCRMSQLLSLLPALWCSWGSAPSAMRYPMPCLEKAQGALHGAVCAASATRPRCNSAITRPTQPGEHARKLSCCAALASPVRPGVHASAAFTALQHSPGRRGRGVRIGHRPCRRARRCSGGCYAGCLQARRTSTIMPSMRPCHSQAASGRWDCHLGAAGSFLQRHVGHGESCARHRAAELGKGELAAAEAWPTVERCACS